MNKPHKDTGHEKNGLAHDPVMSAMGIQVNKSTQQQVRGYLLIAGGVILFFYTFGFLAPLLNWVIRAASVALIIYGAGKVNLLEKAQNLISYIQKKFTKK